MDAKVKAKPKVEIIKEPIPHLLVPGEMGVVLELTVKDKIGKVTEHRVMRSRSFVRQFLELLWIEFNKTSKNSPLIMQDTGNFGRHVFEYRTNFACDVGAGVETRGIIAGTGTTAPTIDDYKIETPIAHGTGAGELQYGDVAFGAPASDATTSQFTITRDFANGSGGAITVNEIGLYVEGYAGVEKYFMIIRDVIDGGISVPNGQTLTVNYREQVVV